MRALVDSGIHLARSEVSPKLAERLQRALSFPNPEYLDRLRLGLSTRTVPERLCFLEETVDGLRLPRGAIQTLRRLAGDEGLTICCEDRRTRPAELISPLRNPPLRPYQERAVAAMAAVTQGLVIVPCGGGKTRIGIGALTRLATPALILVHTHDLAEQWREQVHDLLGIEAAVVGDGRTVLAPITIALVQTLTRFGPGQLDAFLATFGLLLLDEAHHCPSTTFRGVVHLTGHVDSKRSAAVATKVAEGVPGVHSVDNELQVR